MGRISLVVSIVLLAAGTFATVESPIKQDHPQQYHEIRLDGKVRIYYAATSVSLLAYFVCNEIMKMIFLRIRKCADIPAHSR